MCLDSIRTIKCALAGTATSKFTDVLEAVFRIDEENPPEFEAEEDKPDVVPEEGITTKETVEGESLSDPVASTSVWLLSSSAFYVVSGTGSAPADVSDSAPASPRSLVASDRRTLRPRRVVSPA